LQVVPSMLGMLLEEKGIEECGSLKRVFCGGEVLKESVRERFEERLGASLHNLYGPTEATIDALSWNNEGGGKVLIGKPIFNTQVYVLDERMEPVPVGARGELWIAGDCVGRGYLNNTMATAERFVANPFGGKAGDRMYRTGDAVRYLEDGNLEFVGRRDNQVKVRGYRIELGEIEAVLSGYESVGQAVVAVQELEQGKQLVGYVVAKAGAVVDGGRLREYLGTKLPEYMVPVQIVEVEKLPLTASGKVDRKRLPRVNFQAQRTYVAPRNEIEEVLVRIAGELLGVEKVGVHDNFFELGGHSLLATQFISRVREALLVDLALRTLFEAPSVAGVAEVIEWALKKKNAPVETGEYEVGTL
jgi:acyl-coenzyme A synthetase/AMP-(fatty) acid ligase